MKLYLVVIIGALLLITSPAFAQQDSVLALFLGNSYTYTNDLPFLFQELAASAGKVVVYDDYALGGYTLEDHSNDPVAIQKITQRPFDYVVLQEQSQIPTIEYYRYNLMYPSARELDSLITASGSGTAFFMTWGRKYGGQQTWGGYSSPEFVDFFHMQDSLSSAYSEISDELGATLCPVGNAWATAFSQDSTIELWSYDNAHPSMLGSYLTACVFYVIMFDDNPYGLSFMAGIDPETALFLQQSAYQTVVSITERPAMPIGFELYQNYPNPFNANTVIKYDLKKESDIIITIYDIIGREITTLLNRTQPAGSHSVEWDGIDNSGNDVSSGIYFYNLQTDQNSISKRMLLIK